MKRRLLLLCVCALMLTVPHVPSAQADDVAGYYQVSGQNSDGEIYAGTVEIVETGKTLHIRWTLKPNDVQIVGVGLRAGSQLVFSYVTQGRPGLIVYEIDGETLTGRWTVWGFQETWGEVLTRMPADRPTPTAKPKVKPSGRTQQG